MLMNGLLPPAVHGIGRSRTCRKQHLHELYLQHAKTQGVSYRSTETKFGKFLSAQLGVELKSTRPIVGTERYRCYELPPLKKCRELFAAKLGQSFDWGEEWEKDEWQQDGGIDPSRDPGSIFN